MAEPTKPGQGVIVRADFGGGIDQSADAWKVPPNQLSELVNGRLEKVGSVRKRTGYQAAPEPSASNAFTTFSNVLAGSAITFATPFPFPVPTTGGVIEAGRPIVVGSKIVFIALMSVPTTPASTLYYFVTYDPYANSCVGQPIGNTEITDVFDTSNIHTDGVNTVWTREKSNIYKYTVSTNTLTSFAAGAALEGWASAIGTPIVDGYMYAIDNVGSIGLGRMYKTDLATEVTATVGTDRKDTKKLLGYIVRAGEKRLLTVHLNNAQWTDGYGNNALVELSLVDRSVLYTFGAIPTGYLTGPNGDDRNLEDRCVWVDSAQRAYLTLNGYAFMIDYTQSFTTLTDITATLSAVPGFVTGAGFPITTATWGNVAGRQVGGGLSVTYDATNNVVWYASCPVSGSTFPTVVVGLDGDTGVVVQEVRYSPATPIMGLAEIDPVYRIGTGRVQASPTSAITQTNVWGPQTIISQDDPEPGNPVAAASSSKQTVVVDSTRDWSPVSEANDRWAHLNTTDSKIGAESGYVARNHTPTTTVSNYWTSTGPASDVIGDVRILDGNAGNICECVDYGAADNFLFVVKASLAINATSSVAITVSQYDARTGTVVDEHVQTFSTARVYPKMMVFPSLNRILVAVANYSQLSGANTGTVEFLWYEYTDAGLTYSGVLTSDVWRDTIDYFNINLFQGVPEEKYRPAVPFDVAKTGDTTVHFTSYYTGGGAGALRTVGYTVSASGVTFASVGTMAPAGGNPIQALSIEYGQPVNGITGTLIMTAFAAQFNTAVWPYYVGADYQLHVGTFRLDSSANLNYVVRTVLRQSGATPIPGRLTVLQHKISPPDAAPNYGVALGYVEVYEASGAGLATAAHTMFIVHGSGSAFTVERRSYAIPVARAFELTYYDRVTDGTSTISQARLPLVIGASQQSIYGLNAAVATQPPATNYGGNYSATIGTQVLVGAREMTLSCVNSPFQTYAPKLQPCPPPRSIVQADGRYGVPHLVAIDGAAGFAIALVTLRSREAGDAQPSSFADMPVFPAGIVQQSDGERFAEVALVDRPVIHQIVASNAGTAWQMTPGDYLIQAIAAYRDSAGNVHRSTPSDPFRWVQATAPNTGRTLNITFSYQSYTNRNDVQIEFYCTEPNGTVLRYWFSAPNVIGADINVATIHDPSFSTTAPQIGAIGLPALDAPTLYTTGGVLPNVPIPSARFATLYKNRMIVGGSDDPKSVYYSNGPQAYQAAAFAVGNVIRMEHEGGCTAAGALNDKLILFSANGIYATFGQFRDSTGAGDALAELESIHDYIGCTQPISVVSIPVGLLFFATDGRFYMIDERLGLNPIGLRVQELTQAGLNVVQCAVHIEQEREVRFYVTNADKNDSRVFVYNYQVDQWSTDRILADIDSTPVPITSWGGACISPQLACFVPNPQKWVYDNRTTYKDGPYWIPLSASTAWIQPAGTQEYARFRYAQLLGRSISDHNLGVAVYCDFDEATIRAVNIWTPPQLAPIADTVWPEQVRLQVGTQKTQAIKIVISDLEPIGATTGQGPQFVGLALEVLPLGGMRRLPAVRKA